MESKLVIIVTVFAACVAVGYAGECCTAYTDPSGNYHKSMVCDDYCCWDISISTFTEGSMKTCCSSILRRVPESQRDDSCISWISEHIWVPIVSIVLFLAIVIGICTCCCCCACCRTSRPGVIVQRGFGGPSQTVIMSQQQQQMQQAPNMMQPNPAHAGYIQ